MFAYEARYYFPQAPVSCDHVRRGEPSEAEKTESYSLQKFSSYLTDSIRELSLYALFIAEEKEEYFLLSFVFNNLILLFLLDEVEKTGTGWPQTIVL